MNNRISVLFLWKPAPELKARFTKELTCADLIFPDQIDRQYLGELAATADVIVGWRPWPELLEKSEMLKLFINPGAGVQHLIEKFKELNAKRKVILVNGHGNAYFTAQHTVAMLLTVMNRILQHDSWMRQGLWRMGDREAASIPLRNRKIGLLGYGHVNRYVHRFLSVYDVEFYILRNSWQDQAKPDYKYKELYEFSAIDNFLRAIDILIIAVPITMKTDNLICNRELKLLGRDGILMNIGRGAIVNEQDLFSALSEKIIQFAAIDVWYNYSPEAGSNGRKYPFNYPFHELDNILLSPHRAASPFGDIERWDDMIENIKRAASGDTTLLNIVDLNKEY